MENYEQKYKDALERAKRMMSQKEIEYLFPELKESKDERIRKEIINYFRCQSRDEPSRKPTHDKWIDWLEKKKPQEQTSKQLNPDDLPHEVSRQVYQIAKDCGKTFEQGMALLCTANKAYKESRKNALDEVIEWLETHIHVAYDLEGEDVTYTFLEQFKQDFDL